MCVMPYARVCTPSFSLDPLTDTGALTPSADWVKCRFSVAFFLAIYPHHPFFSNQRSPFSVLKRQYLHEDPGLCVHVSYVHG